MVTTVEVEVEIVGFGDSGDEAVRLSLSED